MTEKSTFFINKEAPENFEELLRVYQKKEEPFLFAVIGDLNLSSDYGRTALVVSEKRFLILDLEKNSSKEYFISDVLSTKVKRMYSNAYLEIKTKDGNKEIVIRFTFAVASLMEMASRFISNIANGADFKEEMLIIEETYEKRMRVCSKCGRSLLRAGAPCIKCQSKEKVFKKFKPYVMPQRWNLLLCLVMAMLVSFIQLIPPYTTKVIIDKIIPNNDKKGLVILVLFMFVFYMIHHGLAMLLGYLIHKTGGYMVTHLRNDIYNMAQHLPMKFYDKTSTGQVINRIGNDTNTIMSFILNVVQNALLQFIMLVGIVAIMIGMNWQLTLISLLPVPLVVIGGRAFSKKVAPFYRRRWRKWAAVTSVLTDSIPCIRVVKAFSGEERASKRFEQYNNKWMVNNKELGKIIHIYPNLLAFLMTAGTLAIWAVGGSWAMSGSYGLTPGILVSFISYASMFYAPIRYFASFGDSYQAALSAVEKVIDIIDAEPEVNKEGAIKPETIRGEIEFRNVNFAFDKSKKVLKDVSFKINEGDIVGIVGTTGSGKTTIINLLMRYYDNYDGDILVDGVNIKDMDIQGYRNHIGYVQQEPMMFSDTIYNNIAYGKPDALPEEVINAASVANAHDFIVMHPDAYDSMLGERGVGLSGGERQRISIARAILKNPSILIFDEATASVDSETEELIQQAIDRLISGRTTIMIAHRLSTLRKANKILVVENGKIIEDGSHDELMAKKGKYYKLIEIQSINSKRKEIILD